MTGNSATAMRPGVVVVGAGGSGLAAAVAAAEAGAAVTCLEKAPEIGGTTALSVGSITAAGTRLQASAGITDSPDGHYGDMTVLAGSLLDRDNPRLRRILVDSAADTVHWLESLGVTFAGPYEEMPHKLPRMHVALPNSRSYIYWLERRCRALGVVIHTGVRAASLVTRGGRVCGVEANVDGVVRHFEGGAVVLATGDYSASPELKARYLPTCVDIDAINERSTGDGHEMALREGATVCNGDLAAGPKFRFNAPPRPAWAANLPPHRWLARSMRLALRRLPPFLLRPFLLPTLTSYLAPEPSLFAHGAILVNRDGKRFTDELDAPARFLPTQPGKVGYLVMDERIARMFSRWPHFVSTAPGVAYAYVQDYARIRKDVYTKADTIEALAEALSLPPAALRDTIEANNASLATRPDAGKRAPLSEGPFHALGPLYSWVVVTQGGLAVDEDHHVLREDGNVIQGLFAAGNVGLGGLLMAGHGHYLGWAFISGRRAGARAAQAARIAGGNRT